MNLTIVLFAALILSLIMLTIFSLVLISNALDKKNIHLDLFAFSFKIGKKTKGKIINNNHAEQEVPSDVEYDEQAKNLSVIGMQRDEPPIPKVEEPVINEPQEELEEYIDLDNPVFDDETDAPKNTGSKAAMFVGGMKDKFAQAQYNSQVMSIEKEEQQIQEDLELVDFDDTFEECPHDFGGKIRYWWRNKLAFRVALTAICVFLAAAMLMYGFQIRNRNIVEEGKKEVVAETQPDNSKHEEAVKEDTELNEFRQSLDAELSPVDVAAGSLEEAPNVAEIVSTVRGNIGNTPASYTGSNTTKQPSGSIGTISIPSINLKNAPVMGSVELSDLAKGTGHFENTPLLDGNVGIAGHNNTHFKYLANVDIGDEINYTVNGVTRTYKVTDMRAISDMDWGVFTDYGDNRLTLITCEHAVPNRRIAVTAIQVGTDSGVATAPIPAATNLKGNSGFHQDSGQYHDAGSGYTDYIGTFTGTY